MKITIDLPLFHWKFNLTHNMIQWYIGFCPQQEGVSTSSSLHGGREKSLLLDETEFDSQLDNERIAESKRRHPSWGGQESLAEVVPIKQGEKNGR